MMILLHLLVHKPHPLHFSWSIVAFFPSAQVIASNVQYAFILQFPQEVHELVTMALHLIPSLLVSFVINKGHSEASLSSVEAFFVHEYWTVSATT